MNGDVGASPVVFGERGDNVPLGSVSLEALGFVLDPLKCALRPLPMMLAHLEPGPNGASARRKALIHLPVIAWRATHLSYGSWSSV
jgi:hypothetical protein